MVLFYRFLYQTSLWFPAFTRNFIYWIFLRVSFIRMVRTKIHIIQICALFSKQRTHFLMNRFNILYLAQASRNRWLICNHNRQFSRLVNLFDCITSIFFQFKIFIFPDQSPVLIDSAITI